MTNGSTVVFADFIGIVGDTFDISAAQLGQETRCAEIPGWDSLGYSVLLARLDRRLHLSLQEADVTPPETVGELFLRISAIAARRQ